MIFIAPAFAQEVYGVIRDKTGAVVAEAVVTNVSSGDHTHTNQKGEFRLLLSRSDTLLVEKKGYFPSEILALELDEHSANSILMQRDFFSLQEVEVTGVDNPLAQVANVDLTMQPKASSQELLTLVPGLFVAQHAGGGKSEQMFLRGFDLDHGTDIRISSDNMPVNMVSHAHGQGYTDLHFLIPDLIDEIEFDKGPYSLKQGNFATAGYVNFITKKRIEQNQVSIGYGMFNDRQVTGLFKILDTEKQSLYLGSAITKRDGYFEASQNFNRLNLMTRYSAELNESTLLDLSLSTFRSDWDASGQIPQRAVDAGRITRFGAIDSTEGGNTARSDVNLSLVKFLGKDAVLRTSAFVSSYDFELYSNFTFFSRDSLNGDQIRQVDDRLVYGLAVDYEKGFSWNELDFKLLSGAGMRADQAEDLELSYTQNRITTLEHVQLGDLDETNYFGYAGLELNWNRLTLNGGARAEQIRHQYENKLDSLYNPLTTTVGTLLPKISATYAFNESFSVFAKWGQGYHSNDSRLVLSSPNHATLPTATSTDIGFNIKPTGKLLLNVAFWQMFSEQEFVYVGDEGIVEAGNPTIRKGVDFSASYQPFDALFANINVNYTHAREAGNEEVYIPLAAPLTATGNLNLRLKGGFTAAWQARLMGDRAADEANEVVAPGYFVNDLKLGYQWNRVRFTATLSNVFNVEWNETQFLTESRLGNESAPVEEIHFTPGAPRMLFGKMTVCF